MSDNLPTSPPEGSVAPPTVPSEPSGAAAPAPAVTPSAPPAATSSLAPAPGTTASPAQQSSADLEFAQLQADPNAHDNPFPAPPAQQPAAPAPQPPPQAPPVQPPASEPPAPAEPETPEPTAAEQQEGKVPVKKLVRSLKQRSEFKTRAETAEQALAQERTLTDRVLNAFHAGGIDANSLPTFMANLARHRNDPQAQAQLLASLGVQAPQPAKPTVDLAAVRERLARYDAEGALALLDATIAAQTQPTAPATPPQAPPVVQPPPAQPPPAAPQQVNVLIQTVATMGAVLRDTYGAEEASRLAGLIDAEAKQHIQSMDELGAVVTPEAAARVWRKAQGTVLRAEAQKRQATPAQTTTTAPPAAPPAPSTPLLRPTPPPPPQKLTADQEFAQLQAQGF